MVDAELMLPRYQCHKIVRAAKIVGVRPCGAAGCVLHLTVPGDDTIIHATQSARWFDRHHPEIGGYYVVYDPDNYASYSPAAQFEAGYSLLVPAVPAVPAAPPI